MIVLIVLLLALLTAAIIVLLHREQRRKRADIAERTAPLDAVDLSFPDTLAVTSAAADPAQTEHWQDQVRQLREQQQDEAALQLCRQQFPRIQAFQQAAVILRQRIRTQLEAHQDARQELRELYRIAVMADLYRSSNASKPKDPRRTLQRLQALEFDYQYIGTRQLRLLTKSDLRQLEQLWGRPAEHRHAEEWQDLDWSALCT